MNNWTQRTKLLARRDPFFGDTVEFLLHQRTVDNGAVSVACGTIVMQPRTQDKEGSIPDPTFRLSIDEAQALMDELWRAGLRPTEGSGSAGSLAATQRHLDDMRHLVFKTKPKE